MLSRAARPLWLAGMLAVAAWATMPAHAEGIVVSDAQALSAGKKLWRNECNGEVAGLTSWNVGEDFASLGIGHYIWYPAGRRGPFEESFPDLLRFLVAANVRLPDGVRPADPCPWKDRADFLRDRDSERMTTLRGLLARTVALQARFSANRLQLALPKMLNELPGGERETVRRQFQRVAASPGGVYALVDYVNFKGEGVLPTERYQGRGWGLLQVLAGMRDDPAAGPGAEATREFAASAARVLTQRVENSPPDRREVRWLPGWKSRVRTYSSGG